MTVGFPIFCFAGGMRVLDGKPEKHPEQDRRLYTVYGGKISKRSAFVRAKPQQKNDCGKKQDAEDQFQDRVFVIVVEKLYYGDCGHAHSQRCGKFKKAAEAASALQDIGNSVYQRDISERQDAQEASCEAQRGAYPAMLFSLCYSIRNDCAQEQIPEKHQVQMRGDPLDHGHCQTPKENDGKRQEKKRACNGSAGMSVIYEDNGGGLQHAAAVIKRAAGAYKISSRIVKSLSGAPENAFSVIERAARRNPVSLCIIESVAVRAPIALCVVKSRVSDPFAVSTESKSGKDRSRRQQGRQSIPP